MRPFSEGTDSRADFFVQPIGKDLGTGSDANVKVRITDATGTVVHASAEQVHHGDGRDLDNPPLDVSVPLTPGQTYYLFVENDGGTGANSSSFYFIHHYVGTYWYGFAEEEGPTNSGHNDSLASSEYSQSFDGLPNVYFYDGNLPGGTDSIGSIWSRPAATTTIQCHAQRAGSGLRNFKAELFRANDASTVASATETATSDFFAQGAAPAGAYFLKLSAGSLESGIAGDYYRCVVAFVTL